MGVHRYRVWNGASPTTAALAAVTTGTAIKTMLQLASPSTRQVMICGWGFSVDDPPGADAMFELVETDVAATVTAHVAAGIVKRLSGIPDSLLTLGTSATGYTASAEGSTTSARVFDTVSMSSVSAEAAPFLTYYRNFEADGIPPVMAISKFLRIRATTPTTAVDMRCFIDIEE
jgi:1,6-anhydro-N-acetylmuramate kinase